MIRYKELLFLKSLPDIGKVRINSNYIDAVRLFDSIDDLARLVRGNEKKLTDGDIETALSSAADLEARLIVPNTVVDVDLAVSEYQGNKSYKVSNLAPAADKLL